MSIGRRNKNTKVGNRNFVTTIVLLALYFAFPNASADQIPSGVRAQQNDAVTRARSGSVDSALITLRELRQAYPADPQLMYDETVLMSWVGRDPDVLANSDLIDAGLAPLYVLTAVAKAARNEGDLQTAIQWYALALERNPQYVDANLGMAMTQADSGAYGAASDTLTRLSDEQKSTTAFLLTEAYVLEQNERYLQAITRYDKILETNPDHPGALRAKALALRSLLLPDLALELSARHEGILTDEEIAHLRADRAAREHDRILQLSQEKIVSEDVADEAKAGAATAEAGCTAAASAVEHARSAVDLARVELEKMIIVAPFDGIVADVSIEVGEWTSPSPPALPIPPVIDLIDPTSIYVSAPMDEVDSAQIHKGQRVRVTVDSHRGQEFPGTVQRVAIYVLDLEAQNRAVEIDVELADNPFASTLRPGTTADVEVILEVKEHVLRIPTGALYDGNKVLIVDGDLLAERELELGLKNWNYTEVLSGLEQGESLVTSLDRPEIKAGALVASSADGSVSSRPAS